MAILPRGAVFRASFLAAFLAAGAGGVPGEAALATKLKEKVRAFSFKDIRFVRRALADFGERKAFVVVFGGVKCPVAQRYMPRLEEMRREYEPRGVQFMLINSHPGETLIEVAANALETGVRFPVYKDFDQSALRALGVSHTPETAVLDGAHVLRYRGRIDEQFLLSGESPRPGRSFLREAIEALLAGAEPPTEETPTEGCSITPLLPAELPGVNYAEHVAPILQRHCQECHRPHQAAPLSLLNFEDAADNVRMIAEVVRERRMPPAFGDPRFGDFANRRALSQAEISAIAAWAEAGAPRGNPANEPPPLEWSHDAWNIGSPDLIVGLENETVVPASGVVAYREVILDHDFPHDTWVSAIQILPGNRRVVHHANLYSVAAGYESLRRQGDFITGFVPGGDVTRYGKNSGVLFRRGSALRLQIHYVTTGKEERDLTRVGLVYAKEPILRPTRVLPVINITFSIPPLDPAFAVSARNEFSRAGIGVGLFVHMHLRGKDMTFIARYPDGTAETLLSVPIYSFNWQMSYRWPLGSRRFSPGTVIETISHYDNSSLNPFNPDPQATVTEGRQTFQEMNYGFLFYEEDRSDLYIPVDPATGVPRSVQAF